MITDFCGGRSRRRRLLWKAASALFLSFAPWRLCVLCSSAGLYSLLSILLLLAASKSVRAATPNILYILCDDLGYGDVHYFNKDGKIATPNMDRLAASGMIFTDAHSSSAVCSPTRYGILTGRYNWRSALKQGVLGGYF